MPKLKDIANNAAQAVGDAGRFAKDKVQSGAQAANDAGKSALETADKTTKPVRDFASAAGGVVAKGARAAGKFYLRHRDRIDTATVAYPVGQQVASSIVARSVATKLLGVAGGAAALHATPIILAATAVLYGPKIVKQAKDFLSTGDTLAKAKKGDANAIKDLVDTIAETVAQEKPEAVEELSDAQKAEIKELAKAIEDGEKVDPETVTPVDTQEPPANDDERDNGAPAP